MPISTEHRPHNFIDAYRYWAHLSDRQRAALDQLILEQRQERGRNEDTHQGADRDSGSSHRDDRTDSDCLGTSDGP